MALEHHLQKKILHHLVKVESAKFAELRPKNVDSNAFTYHLKQLLKDGYAVKNSEGEYEITAKGKVAGTTVSLSNEELSHQAHSIILLALKTKNDGWLLRRRLVHPEFGKWGFVHAEPVSNENIFETVKSAFLERTGLECDFEHRGSGYFKLFRNNELESFVHFEIFFADSFKGELLARTRNGENEWHKEADFNGTDMIASQSELVELLNEGKKFFTELRYDLTD